MNEIKNVMLKHTKGLKVDKHLAKSVRRWCTGIFNKNEDSVAFLGGNLLGVHNPKFIPAFSADLYNILGIDDLELRDDLRSLDCIEVKFKITSDTFNHTLVWLMHLFATSKMSKKDSTDTANLLGMMLFYKYTTSLVYGYLRYGVSESVAVATYAALTYNSHIRKYGSYGKLFEVYGEAIFTGIHQKTMVTYSDSDKVLYVISNTQTKIRLLVRKVVETFYEIHESDGGVTVAANTFQGEDGLVLKDVTTDNSKYTTYISTIIADKHDFIKPELVSLVCGMLSRLPTDPLQEVLEYMSKHSSKDKNVDSLLKSIVTQSLTFLNNEQIPASDLGLVLSRLRNVYQTSRNVPVDVVHCRELGEKVVAKATSTKSPVVHVSLRTGIQLYIVLRMLTLNHYK